MSAVRTFISRIRLLAERSHRDAALAEEIDCHLDMLAAEFRAQGLTDREARLKARREFGSVDRVKESARDEQGFPLIESLWQDVVFALRQLRRSPSFTIAALLTLAIGIGGTAGIFSVLDVCVPQPFIPGCRSARGHPRRTANFGRFGQCRRRRVLVVAHDIVREHRARDPGLHEPTAQATQRGWRSAGGAALLPMLGVTATSAACLPTARRSPVPTRSSC